MNIKMIMTDPKTGKEFEIQGMPNEKSDNVPKIRKETLGIALTLKDGMKMIAKRDTIIVRLDTSKELELIPVFSETENAFLIIYGKEILQKDELKEKGFAKEEIKELLEIIEELKKDKENFK